MKKIAIFLSAVTLASTVQALPNYEPFADATGSGGTAYTVGANLVGQINAQGLTWYQVGAGAPAAKIASGNLSISGLASSSGNSLSITPLGSAGSTWTYSRFGLDSSGTLYTDGTLYYSMAMRVADLGSTLQAAGGFIAAFNSSAGASSGNTVSTGLLGRTVLRPVTFGDASAGFQIGVQKQGNASDMVYYTDQAFMTSDTVFLVVSYTFNGGSQDDVASMWINPSSGTFGAVSAPTPTLFTTTAVNDGTQLGSFLFFQRSSALNPNEVIFDELRMGTSWADVTPAAVVPEPISAGLMGLGLLALSGWYRRKRR